jgi:hypothetical protein
MASDFRLLGAALAAALIAQASPAYAETLVLACEDDSGPRGTFTVDFDRKTVQAGSSVSCTVPLGGGREVVVPDCNPPGRAEITERHISWKTTRKTVDGAGGIHNSPAEGSIDRLTGNIVYSETPDNSMRWGFSGKCRRATQKF